MKRSWKDWLLRNYHWVIFGAVFIEYTVSIGLANNIYSLFIIPVTQTFGITGHLFHRIEHQVHRGLLLEPHFWTALPALGLPHDDDAGAGDEHRGLCGLCALREHRALLPRRGAGGHFRILLFHGGHVPHHYGLVPPPPGDGARHRHGGQRPRRDGVQRRPVGGHGALRLAQRHVDLRRAAAVFGGAHRPAGPGCPGLDGAPALRRCRGPGARPEAARQAARTP